MLRPELVRRKLQLITDDLAHLDRYRAITREELVSDVVALAAVERLLERVVMRAIDVNRHLLVEVAAADDAERATRLTYHESFLRLAGRGVYPDAFAGAIAPSARLRNVLVHDYNDADRRLIHGAIRACLEQYPRYVMHVLAYLDRLDDRLDG